MSSFGELTVIFHFLVPASWLWRTAEFLCHFWHWRLFWTVDWTGNNLKMRLCETDKFLTFQKAFRERLFLVEVLGYQRAGMVMNQNIWTKLRPGLVHKTRRWLPSQPSCWLWTSDKGLKQSARGLKSTLEEQDGAEESFLGGASGGHGCPLVDAGVKRSSGSAQWNEWRKSRHKNLKNCTEKKKKPASVTVTLLK